MKATLYVIKLFSGLDSKDTQSPIKTKAYERQTTQMLRGRDCLYLPITPAVIRVSL